MLVYFAMHPTVLPNTNTLLGADVDGALSRILEHDMQREWNDAVAESHLRDPAARSPRRHREHERRRHVSGVD